MGVNTPLLVDDEQVKVPVITLLQAISYIHIVKIKKFKLVSTLCTIYKNVN